MRIIIIKGQLKSKNKLTLTLKLKLAKGMSKLNITDEIAKIIIELIDEQGGTAQIQRNDLAGRLGCVPSQINYAITSRFTKAQGYIVESRRGGGGFIKIVKLDHSKSQMIMHIINSIDDRLDEQTARILINSLCLDGQLEKSTGRLILSALSDDNFKGLPDTDKQTIRANLMKSMLINTIE